MKAIATIMLVLTMALPCSATGEDRQKLTLLFSQAEQCYLIDDYLQLEALMNEYNRVLNACRDALGDSADVFQAYADKMAGCYYYSMADTAAYAQKAESHYRRSLAVFDSRVITHTIGGMHPNAVTLHEELAQLYYRTKDYKQAREQLDTVAAYYDDRVTMGIDTLRGRYYATLAQLAMCNARTGRFAEARQLIDEAIGSCDTKDADYYEMLRKRAKILMIEADHTGTADYAEATACYRQYVDSRYRDVAQQLATMSESQRSQYWLATHRFLYDCYRLGNHAPAMLYDLALFSKGFLLSYAREDGQKEQQHTRWQQVQQQLGSDDCAVEFVQYFARDDQRRMGCLVVTPKSTQPQFIDLFATDSVLSMKVSSTFNVTVDKAIRQTKPQHGDCDDKCFLYKRSEELPRLIWSPQLMQAIGTARHVYFAPDGMLHVLAIEYMMHDRSKTCYRLSSTRTLCRRRETAPLDSALLCGGIVYDTRAQPRTDGNDQAAYRSLSKGSPTIGYLKGSLREILAAHSARHNPHDTLITDTTATDERFLALLRRRYPLVMLSTHGFYRGDIGVGSDIKPARSDHAMSQSGLIFAGAQTMLRDSTFDSRLYDGILSAKELATQDLTGTRLMVLSACETGLGQLTDDGIYGLVRGLKLAGASALVLSLWEVNDVSSSLFMQFFISNLQRQRKTDMHDAFFKARQQLKKYDKGKYDKPSHTCPFILIDAI